MSDRLYEPSQRSCRDCRHSIVRWPAFAVAVVRRTARIRRSPLRLCYASAAAIDAAVPPRSCCVHGRSQSAEAEIANCISRRKLAVLRVAALDDPGELVAQLLRASSHGLDCAGWIGRWQQRAAAALPHAHWPWGAGSHRAASPSEKAGGTCPVARPARGYHRASAARQRQRRAATAIRRRMTPIERSESASVSASVSAIVMRREEHARTGT